MDFAWDYLTQIAETNAVPDFVTRHFMRRLIAQRLTSFKEIGVEKQQMLEEQFIAELKTLPIAVKTAEANEQHYEVPTEFYQLCLGPRLKYSSCYFDTPKTTLGEAEDKMFDMYCERAQLVDGMTILDCGCGWGSLTLYLAERYPNSQVFAISNSATQKTHIDNQAKSKGFNNVTVFTSDINDFDFLTHDMAKGKKRKQVDRVMSVEMFEHMKNYETLLGNISKWLKPDGFLFVHIFTFAHHSYHYEVTSPADWMTKWFFEGGTMPHAGLLGRFQRDMTLESQWTVNGVHYSRTLEEWLKLCDSNQKAVRVALASAYGADNVTKWLARWRMFFMACSELFAYNEGESWFVSHYLFRPRAQ